MWHWVLIATLVVSFGSPTGWTYEGYDRLQNRDKLEVLMKRYHLLPAFQKLGRGASNFLGGWMEVPLNIGKRRMATNTGGSFFAGAAIGGFKGLVRTGVGLYEMLTFFLPFPKDYALILPTLEYYQRLPRRDRLLLE